MDCARTIGEQTFIANSWQTIATFFRLRIIIAKQIQSRQRPSPENESRGWSVFQHVFSTKKRTSDETQPGQRFQIKALLEAGIPRYCRNVCDSARLMAAFETKGLVL